MAYADDTSIHDSTRQGLQLSTNKATLALAVIGVRMNAKKTFYTWSPRGPCDSWKPSEADGNFDFWGVDGSGTYTLMRATDVPPVGDPKADLQKQVRDQVTAARRRLRRKAIA